MTIQLGVRDHMDRRQKQLAQMIFISISMEALRFDNFKINFCTKRR